MADPQENKGATLKSIDPNMFVMIVDPQQDLRLIIAHQLAAVGFKRVVQCKNGLDALALLKDKDRTVQFSLMFCSMELDEMNGLELLDELKEDPSISRPPFCLTMSDANRDKIMLAVEKGVDELLAKPFTLGDIIPKVTKTFSTFHNPKNPEKVYEFAKTLIRDKKLDEAEALYSKLYKMSPNSARPLVGLARMAYLKNDTAKALKLLDEAQAKNSTYVHLFSLRGEIYSFIKEPTKALEAFRQAIEISPLNPIRYISAAEILLGIKEYQLLIDLLNYAMQKNVHFHQLFHYLGTAYYFLNDYKNAIKFVKRALAKDPDNLVALNQYALALKETGEYDEAMKSYNRVLKLDPENLQAAYNKANLLAHLDKRKEAIKLLERTVEKFPQFVKAQKRIAELRKEDGQAA